MKKAFSNLIKIFKYSFKSSKIAIFIVILIGLIKGLALFLPLIFNEQVVNLIYNSSVNSLGFKDIFIIASIFIVSIFLTNLLYSILNSYFNSLISLLYGTTDLLLAKRSLTLDYEVLEKEENKLMLQKARDGQNSSGGIGNFLSNIANLIQNIFVIILGFSYIGELFKVIDISKIVINEEVTSSLIFRFTNSWYIGLILVIFIILALILTILLISKMYKISNKFFEENVDYNHKYAYFARIFTDYHLGKDIRIFNLKDVAISRMKEIFFKLDESYGGLAKKVAKNQIGVSIISSFIILLGYILVSLKAYCKIIELGSIITIVGSITNVLNALVSIFSLSQDMLLQSTYLSYFEDYINLKNDDDKKDYVDISEVKAPYVFRFNHVSFKYPNQNEYALDDVSFTLGKFNKTAIVGKNGAGKSTIIKLIARFYKPEKGEILVNNININKFRFKDYQTLFGVVFQDFSLFPLTIKENVSGNKKINEEEIKEDLDKVNFNYQKFEKGIDTYLYNYIEKGIEVSGGEAQKIAIARTLYKDSDYVFLDEPTSALDPISEAEIYSLFDKLVTNKKAIYISHRMSSTKFCDDIIVLDKGKIIEEGSHEELMKINNGVYQELFNAQAKYYK